VKLWIYVIGGGAIAAYIASIAAKSMFPPCLERRHNSAEQGYGRQVPPRDRQPSVLDRGTPIYATGKGATLHADSAAELVR